MNASRTSEWAAEHGSQPMTAARQRIVDAAVQLFAERGVAGTSLKDIADALGVTKAAVYHQFKTKEEIVLAAVGGALQGIAVAVEQAQHEATPDEAAAEVIATVVALAVDRRRLIRTVQGDPELLRIIAKHHGLKALMELRDSILLRGRGTPEDRARVAFLAAAFGGAPAHPLVADIDAATLNDLFGRIARELLGLTPAPASEKGE